jgi:hypothetical protein
MRTVYSFAYLFGICAMAAAVAGCGPTTGSSTPAVGLDATGPRSLADLHTTAVRAGIAHTDRSPTWLSPDIAKATKVLFVTDAGTNDVYLFKLSTLKHLGTITGFDNPQGACSDNKGNVWVANYGAGNILEYSHEGVLENTLTDSTGYPAGCAWDPTTGNLAVTNLFDASSEPGAVLIYRHASGSPVAYRNKAQSSYYFAGYDTEGNLYFDGKNATGDFMLSELPKGAAKAYSIEIIGGTIYFPGMVEWYATGKYLIVGDQSCGDVSAACLYHLTIAHKAGTIAGKTTVRTYKSGNLCDLVQATQDGTQVFGSDYEYGGSTCSGLPSTTYSWPYPAGKDPLVYSTAPTESEPIGAAVSK